MQAYHGVDVLIIDDLQNIIGKRASVDYLFQLMDEFIRNNKKVVIAADRAPKDLSMDAVSYTHLDVYKRQLFWCPDYTSAVLDGDMKCLLLPDRAPQFYSCLLYTSRCV